MQTDDNKIEKEHQGSPPVGQGGLNAHGLGKIWLVWSDVGLQHLILPDAPRPYASGEGPARARVPKRFAEPLNSYFRGEAVELRTIAVDPHGTEFQRMVWKALRMIPRGKVKTYGSVATDLGSPRGMRAVGAANAANPVPIVIPCHRVVEQGHRLGGYAGGAARKRWLLELEGVNVLGDRVMPGQLELF
jgi:methylated-DNA-[protein]-cysteine S-methyltransferase